MMSFLGSKSAEYGKLEFNVMGSDRIVSPTFPELNLTVEEILGKF